MVLGGIATRGKPNRYCNLDSFSIGIIHVPHYNPLKVLDFSVKTCDLSFLPIEYAAPQQKHHLSNDKRAPGCLGYIGDIRGLYYPVM